MASNRNNKRWPLSPKHPNMLSFHIFDQAECDWKRYLNAFLQNLSTVNFNAHIYFSSHHIFTLFYIQDLTFWGNWEDSIHGGFYVSTTTRISKAIFFHLLNGRRSQPTMKYISYFIYAIYMKWWSCVDISSLT